MPERQDGLFDARPSSEILPDSSGSLAMSRRASRPNATATLPNNIPLGPNEGGPRSRGSIMSRQQGQSEALSSIEPGQGKAEKIERGSGLAGGGGKKGDAKQGGTSNGIGAALGTPSTASPSKVALPGRREGIGTDPDAESSQAMGAAAKGDLLGASSIDSERRRVRGKTSVVRPLRKVAKDLEH